jgi:hypothetical protein
MSRLALLLTLGLARCGHPGDSVPRYDVTHQAPAPELEQLVRDFEWAWGHEVRIPTLIVADTEMATYGAAADTVGLCTLDDSGPLVLVGASYWAAATPAERRVLVFHELGHCALGREHRPMIDEGTKCPMSIMFPSVTGAAACLGKGLVSARAYDDELFGEGT